MELSSCRDVFNFAVAGFTNLASPENGYELRAISEVYHHPFYDAESNDNDISVIKLASPIAFTDNIRPACLETLENETVVYDKCYISGWGATVENGTCEFVSFILKQHLENVYVLRYMSFFVDE